MALAAAPANAALSGFYDSAEQIKVILSSSEVADAARQVPIEAMTRIGSRDDGAQEWSIKTQACTLKVYLKPIATAGPGKTTYQLAGPVTCD